MRAFYRKSENPALAQLEHCARICKVVDLGKISVDGESGKCRIVKDERVNYRFASMDEMEAFLEQTLEKKLRNRKKPVHRQYAWANVHC